jgi:hypothetical protein
MRARKSGFYDKVVQIVKKWLNQWETICKQTFVRILFGELHPVVKITVTLCIVHSCTIRQKILCPCLQCLYLMEISLTDITKIIQLAGPLL